MSTPREKKSEDPTVSAVENLEQRLRAALMTVAEGVRQGGYDGPAGGSDNPYDAIPGPAHVGGVVLQVPVMTDGEAKALASRLETIAREGDVAHVRIALGALRVVFRTLGLAP